MPSLPAAQAVAVDLDVLGDVGPLWQAWLEDAARRARVSALDPARLDEQLPNWRALLQHFAEDHAPVFLRPSAPVTLSLRRLQSSGAVIGVFTPYPEELAQLALAHLGASRRVGSLECGDGAEERLLTLLGPSARVARTRAELDL
jgi:phosphoglycolate phosphatase-like HAD superfamily hydrolase